jgi:hypothetical protein
MKEKPYNSWVFGVAMLSVVISIIVVLTATIKVAQKNIEIKNLNLELTLEKEAKFGTLEKMYNLFTEERRDYFNYYLVVNNMVGNISDKSFNFLKDKLKSVKDGPSLEELIKLTSDKYEITFIDFTEEDMWQAVKEYFEVKEDTPNERYE